MAEKLDDYIAKLKADQAKSGIGTFDWYLKKIRELVSKQNSSVSANTMLGEAQADPEITEAARDDVANNNVLETGSQPTRSMIGQMLFFNYDPKGKNTLPYYDVYPLIFPFSMRGNRMWGMNMHYLPPVERAKLMRALMFTANSTKIDPQTKLQINYKLLNNSSQYSYFKPCIKSYLLSNIRSRLMVINAEAWLHVMFMPLANFMKANDYQVWNDSIQKIRASNINI